VIDRILGFPGYRYLQNGDVIMGAITEKGDAAINRSEDLAVLVNNYHDGDTIQLRILRAGQTITVAIRLAARPNWPAPQQQAFLTEGIQELPAIRQRQDRADEYWNGNFAYYTDESVS
jgi:hypothetical protein